jgi:DNA polymerase V
MKTKIFFAILLALALFTAGYAQTLDKASDSTQELLEHNSEALSRIYEEGYGYRRAGVLFSGLILSDQLTNRLFGSETLERFRKVIPVIDTLNRKYGRDTAKLGSANPQGRWKTRAVRPPPRYTTRLADIPNLY